MLILTIMVLTQVTCQHWETLCTNHKLIEIRDKGAFKYCVSMLLMLGGGKC